MDYSVAPELEELTICRSCKLPFNDHDAVPKLLTCHHYFCLKCVNQLLRKGNDELYCSDCYNRTDLQGPESKPENLRTYKPILYLTQNLNTLNFKIKYVNNVNSSNTNGTNNSNNNGVIGDKPRSSSITSNGSNGGSFGSSSNIHMHANINGSNSNLNCTTSSNTNLSDKMKIGENCLTHAMPNNLWCNVCNILLCRACAATEEHRSHAIKNQLEAKEALHNDITSELKTIQNTLNDMQRLVLKQRDFLLKILESCTMLKTQIESELINHIPTLEFAEMHESLSKARLCLEMCDKQTPAEALKLFNTLHCEKQRLTAKYQEIFLQCKLDDLIRNFGFVFDFDLIKQALIQLHNCAVNGGNFDNFGVGLNGVNAMPQNPVLLLANYCISQLYSRHMLVLKQQQQQAQQQQQQQQQLQQQQLLNKGLLTSMISHTNLSSNLNGTITSSSFAHATYAQALQQNQQSITTVQQQQPSHNNDSPVSKSCADITTANNKTNLHAQQQQQQQQHQQLLQQQQQTSNGFPELAPIGTPASNNNVTTVARNTASQLFAGNDLSGLGLSLLHLQHQAQTQQQQQAKSSMLLNPTVHVYPIYYFNIETNGQHNGRILIEVRSDAAPKMAKNFNALATHELGYGYKGCHIFQCWENESIITGDFELNNGRGGRSVYDEGYFMPDDTKILAIRGSVGMRRSQKRHDNLGLVGSQFRIILREMRGFTGIFGFVVEGLELVEKISQTGDATGKPQSSVVIANCGKYQLG